jgi:hypothetical protein
MKRLLGVALAFLLVAGMVSAQEVGYNFDQKADFSKYHTYKWVPIKGNEDLPELAAKQLTDTFEKQLAARGLTKATGDASDLLIGYQVAVNQEKEMTSYGTGGYGAGWGPRWGGGYYGTGVTTTTTSTIHVGSVALDMYDAGTKQLVWRGIASKEMDLKASPEKRQKNLDKGLAKLLKNYPPKAKK